MRYGLSRSLFVRYERMRTEPAGEDDINVFGSSSPRPLSPKSPNISPMPRALKRSSSGLRPYEALSLGDLASPDIENVPVKRPSARTERDADEREPTASTVRPWFSGISHLFSEEGPTEELVIEKPRADTRIGINLLPGHAHLAIVFKVRREGPAATADDPVGLFDRILQVNGMPATSAVDTVRMIKQAPPGLLRLTVRRCQSVLLGAAVRLQRAWRRRAGLQLVYIHKLEAEEVIGISFSPYWRWLAVVERVHDKGLAFGILRRGDIVKSVNGELCQTAAHAARMLRAASGKVSVVCWHAKYLSSEAVEAHYDCESQ